MLFLGEQTSTLILPNGTVVPLEYIAALICLILLVVGYIFFPPLRYKSSLAQPTQAEISAKLKEHQDKAAVAAGPSGSPPTSASGDGLPEETDLHDIDLSADDPMARLVSLGQTEMSLSKLTALVKEFYPDLTPIMKHINPEYSSTIDTMSRHILGIARFKIKITDQSLNNDQFANFQRRIFEDEEKEILRMYKPEESKITDANRGFIGTLVDDRDWEIAQRNLRGDRDDWVGFSMAEAKNLLS